MSCNSNNDARETLGAVGSWNGRKEGYLSTPVMMEHTKRTLPENCLDAHSHNWGCEGRGWYNSENKAMPKCTMNISVFKKRLHFHFQLCFKQFVMSRCSLPPALLYECAANCVGLVCRAANAEQTHYRLWYVLNCLQYSNAKKEHQIIACSVSWALTFLIFSSFLFFFWFMLKECDALRCEINAILCGYKMKQKMLPT